MSKNTIQQRSASLVTELTIVALTAWAMSPVIASAQVGPPGGGAGLGSVDRTMKFPVRPLPADAPLPSSDPRNFEGTWHGDRLLAQIGTDMFGDRIPFNALGQKIADRRYKAQETGQPFVNASARCRPVGLHWQLMADPIHIHQTDSWLDLTVYHHHARFYIFLDPKLAMSEPQYNGVSVGHWEADTLVVETTKFKLDAWLDTVGTPASKDAKLTTRFRKVHLGDRWYLEALFTLEDPKYYTRPWSWTLPYYWSPDRAKIAEYNCEEQMGDRGANRNAGLVPEPQD
jgi:hypothetical protein